MSDDYLDPEAMQCAKECCTPKQYEALFLRNKGYGLRSVARRLGISTGAARDRLDGAERHLKAVMEEKRRQNEEAA